MPRQMGEYKYYFILILSGRKHDINRVAIVAIQEIIGRVEQRLAANVAFAKALANEVAAVVHGLEHDALPVVRVERRDVDQRTVGELEVLVHRDADVGRIDALCADLMTDDIVLKAIERTAAIIHWRALHALLGLGGAGRRLVISC